MTKLGSLHAETVLGEHRLEKSWVEKTVHHLNGSRRIPPVKARKDVTVLSRNWMAAVCA
jgi:hypothetical protein